MAHSFLPHITVPAPPDIIVGFGSGGGGSGGAKARRWAVAPDWAHAGKSSDTGVPGDVVIFGIGMGPPGTLSGTVFGRSPWWSTIFGAEAGVSSGGGS